MGKGIVRNVLRDKRPYKVYTALLTQTETNPPTAIVLENTIGDIVWTRDDIGIYRGTLINAFILNKTSIFHSLNNDGNLDFSMQSYIDNQDSIIVITGNTNMGSTLSDDILYIQSPIEIRVYN